MIHSRYDLARSAQGIEVVYSWWGGLTLFLIAYDASIAIPQIPVEFTPRFIWMYPDIPHDVPHEFLTVHASAVYPTTSTPWSSLVPQAASNTCDTKTLCDCPTRGGKAPMQTSIVTNLTPDE